MILNKLHPILNTFHRHLFVAAFLAVAPLAAQEPVPVGKGSYASFPPAGLAKGRVEAVEKRPLFLVKDDDRPIPSNKWYQNLILTRFATGLWPYPHKVDTRETGLAVWYPTAWKADGSALTTDFPLLVGAKGFKAADARAKDWSDWTVSFRLAETPEKYFDVTLGEGMPYVWIECRGLQPTLAFAGKDGGAKSPPAKFTCFDAAGKALALPAAGEAIGLDCNGRSYGVFAPDGTKFAADGDGLAVEFTGAGKYLVLCPLPAAKDLELFRRHAFAVPRDTRFSWKYDPAKGAVTTSWKVVTESLKGDEKRIIQGWLPHHCRGTSAELAFNGVEYLTGRGRMRCATGNEFSITYPYAGIVPNLPAARKLGGDHDYDPARMSAYLGLLAGSRGFARDTYAGGKDLVRQLQGAVIAKQTGDPSYAALFDPARAELANWMTYSPGETERFFAFYPRRKGIVGFPSGFGSEHFTDNHFHYGYFTFAAALAAGNDAKFAAEYGPMARLVAKQYANWERDDKRFPFLRTFDIWRGHSFADGNGFPDGNNQESTSEAVQSWSGMILLGEALGDKDMTAAGVMGYAIETRAVMEYWFNAGGDVFPPEWKHPIAGMIWSSGKVWGTWFTASPSWIYGIQWIPSSPAAAYLADDPEFARKGFQTMLREFEADEEKTAARKKGYAKKPAAIRSFGGELGSYMLGYALLYDPQWVAAQLDELWAEPGDKVAHSPWMANIYHLAHSLRTLGRRDRTCHGSSAASMVVVNPATKARTYVVWNPLPTPQVVRFYEGDKPLGELTAAPQTITGGTELKAIGSSAAPGR